jgi:hypothetical protein
MCTTSARDAAPAACDTRVSHSWDAHFWLWGICRACVDHHVLQMSCTSSAYGVRGTMGYFWSVLYWRSFQNKLLLVFWVWESALLASFHFVTLLEINVFHTTHISNPWRFSRKPWTVFYCRRKTIKGLLEISLQKPFLAFQNTFTGFSCLNNFLENYLGVLNTCWWKPPEEPLFLRVQSVRHCTTCLFMYSTELPTSVKLSANLLTSSDTFLNNIA